MTPDLFLTMVLDLLAVIAEARIIIMHMQFVV